MPEKVSNTTIFFSPKVPEGTCECRRTHVLLRNNWFLLRANAPRMPNHDNQGWGWCRKAFFQVHISGEHNTPLALRQRIWTSKGRQHMPLYSSHKTVTLHLVRAPYFYFERCTTERSFSVSDLLTSITRLQKHIS